MNHRSAGVTSEMPFLCDVYSPSNAGFDGENYASAEAGNDRSSTGFVSSAPRERASASFELALR
jgi:hypothetical protein